MMEDYIHNICIEAKDQLNELQAFLEANPSLEHNLRISMANLFSVCLGIESLRNPALIQSTEEIINLTLMAATLGYRKALEDNPIIKGNP